MSVSLREVVSLEGATIISSKRARSQISSYSDEHNEIDQEQDFVPPKSKQISNYPLTPQAKQEVEWFRWLTSDCKKPMPAGDMPNWVKNHLQSTPQDEKMTEGKRKSEDSKDDEAEDEKKQLIVKLKLPNYVLKSLGLSKKIFGSKEAMGEKQIVEGGLEVPAEETGDGNKSAVPEEAELGGVPTINSVTEQVASSYDDLDERERRLEGVRREIAEKHMKLKEIRAMKAAKKAAKEAKRLAKGKATAL